MRFGETNLGRTHIVLIFIRVQTNRRVQISPKLSELV